MGPELQADVAAEELTAAGAPVNGAARATAAVTLLDFVRYHEAGPVYSLTHLYICSTYGGLSEVNTCCFVFNWW